MRSKTTIQHDDTSYLAGQLMNVTTQLETLRADHQRLLDSIDEVPMAVDPETFEIIKISPACERITGYTAEHMLDNPCWRSYIHPGDTHLVAIRPEDLADGVIRKQYRIIHYDGQIRWIECKYMRVEVRKNSPTYLCILIKDITKIKRSQRALMEGESLFRQFFDRAHEAIVVVDLSTGCICDYNQTALELLKYDGSEMLKQTPQSISPEYQPDGRLSAHVIEATIQSALRNEKPVLEWTGVDSEGRLIPTEIRINAVTSDSRTLIRASIMDITERKKAAAELQALNESLEQKVKKRTAELINANNQLERFSYTVSHDLQAPLRVITGYSTMLMEEYGAKLDGGAKDMLTVINGNIRRMGILIKDLLDFAKLGSHDCHKTTVDMEQIVMSVKEEVQFTQPECRARFLTRKLHNADCDPGLIRQVWANLISNAVKYSSKKDAPVVEIGSTLQDGMVTYHVRDNGAGFDMAYASKLFKVFSRLHGMNEFEGTGVGLATVNSIISRHGGQVWADSTLGHCATFYFSLPA